MSEEISTPNTLVDVQKKIRDLMSTADDLHAALNYIGNAHPNTSTPETAPDPKDPRDMAPELPAPAMSRINVLLNELGETISNARDKAYNIRNWVNPSE